MEPIIGSSPSPAAAADLIKDSDIKNFAEDVVRTSMDVPVLVDFWAPWCGPCKQLTPMIEKAVTAAAGKVKLVKVNIDENQAIAQQLRIQSIPAVYAFKQGQPVDGFVGALPESQIRAFIERLIGGAIGPTPVEETLEAARAALEAGDTGEALQAFAAVLDAEPDNVAAQAGLARCYVAEGELEAAADILDQVAAEHAGDPEIVGARAALTLAQDALAAADPDETAALTGRIDANPQDYEARFELAVALNAGGRREEAVDQLLAIIKANRGWNDEAARKQLLTFFEAWGPTDPFTVDSRRQLSTILFS